MAAPDAGLRKMLVVEVLGPQKVEAIRLGDSEPLVLGTKGEPREQRVSSTVRQFREPLDFESVLWTLHRLSF